MITFNTEFFYFAILFILGLCVGSFINVVNYRLPKMLHDQWYSESQTYLNKPLINTIQQTISLYRPSSFCVHCHTPLSAREKIPLLSFLFLKAQCKYCQRPISWQYPSIEFFAGFITLMMGLYYSLTLQMAGAIILCLSLLTLSCIDFKHQLLPDIITLPLLWIGLLFNLNQTFASLQDAVIGAITGYSILWIVAKIFYCLTAKQGMGYGDMKLLAALGAWLGWQSLLQILIIASFVGSIYGCIWLLSTRQASATTIPFGPFLATAGIIALLWGKKLNIIFLYLLL